VDSRIAVSADSVNCFRPPRTMADWPRNAFVKHLESRKPRISRGFCISRGPIYPSPTLPPVVNGCRNFAGQRASRGTAAPAAWLAAARPSPAVVVARRLLYCGYSSFSCRVLVLLRRPRSALPCWRVPSIPSAPSGPTGCPRSSGPRREKRPPGAFAPATNAEWPTILLSARTQALAERESGRFRPVTRPRTARSSLRSAGRSPDPPPLQNRT
jgi:hypothetical protein